MTQIRKYVIYYPFIFLFLTYCMLGCDNKGTDTNPTKQHKLSLAVDEIGTSTKTNILEDEATKKIEAFLVSNPNNFEAHYNLGYLYEEKFMFKDALEAYKKASVLNPSSEEPLIGQGRILNKNKEYDKAISVFENAIELNPKRMEIFYYLGNAYVKTGKPDDATSLWQNAIEKNQDTSHIQYLKGLICKNKRDFENAEAFLKKALEIDPEFVAVHKVLEALYSSKGMYGEAFNHAEIYRDKFTPLLPITPPEEPTTTVKEQTTTVEEQAITVKESTATIEEQATTVKESTATIEEQATTVKESTATVEEQATTVKESTTTVEEQTTTIEEQEFTTDERSTSTSENNILWGALPGSASTSQKEVTSVKAKKTENLKIRDIHDALNFSGKTRMLSMRMTNLYGVQILKDYPTGKKQLAKKQLIDAKRIISECYNALLAYTPVEKSQELTQAVRAAQTNWHQLEKVLSHTPALKRFSDVLDASDKLLDANEIMTSYMESLSPVPMTELINIAGRQQMYSQKLLRDYLAASMDVDKEYRIDLMLDAAVEFESTMLALEGASENTSEIKGLINSITKMEWRKVYEAATECIESNGTKFNVPLMVKFCDTLLDKTDRLTKLYMDVSHDDVK